MFNSETLEVAIGMTFLFLATALVCTAVREWLESLLRWRAMDLERGLRTLLGDPDGHATAELLAHPALDALFTGQYDPGQLRRSWLSADPDARHMRWSKRRNLPSYIPSRQFAIAFLDMVGRGPIAAGTVSPAAESGDPAPAPRAQAPMTVTALRQRAAELSSPRLQRALLTALDHAGDELQQARQNIEHWFDATMERVSGWYKRRTQGLLLLIGLAMAAVLNIDAFHVMQRLTTDKAFRETVVAASGHAPEPGTAASQPNSQTLVDVRQALDGVPLPIGWRHATAAQANANATGTAASTAAATGAPAATAASTKLSRDWPVPVQRCANGSGSGGCVPLPTTWLEALSILGGWLATAFAVMLGAPFWFDILNRFIVIRSTIKPATPTSMPASPPSAAPASPTPGGTAASVSS